MEDKEVKEMLDLYKDCYGIPKIELHATLYKNIRRKTFAAGLDSSSNNWKEDLKPTVVKILNNLDDVPVILIEVVDDFMKQNVIYLELIVHFLHYNKEQFLSHVTRALVDNLDETSKIKVRVVVGIEEVSDLKEFCEIYKMMANKELIVGVSLSQTAWEDSEFSKLKDLLYKVRQSGLKINFDVQKDCVENIINLLPHRITLYGSLSQESIQALINKEIKAVICPTESYKAMNVYSYSKTNLPQMYQAYNGLNIGVCCDGCLINTTDSTQELFEASKCLKLTALEARSLMKSQLNLAFDNSDTIKALEDNF